LGGVGGVGIGGVGAGVGASGASPGLINVHPVHGSKRDEGSVVCIHGG
jgi:hypothetical protein